MIQKEANITRCIIRNATSFFFFGAHNIGAKALETKWLHLFGTNLKVFAEFLKKFNGHGVRSYAKVYTFGFLSCLGNYCPEYPIHH